MRRRILLSGGVSIDPTAGRETIGGYEVVDLGLPSGLLFATWNVGATKETEYGGYYKYGYGSTKYQDEPSDYNHYEGTEEPLASSADTATQVMGSEWRMPTREELYELTANTKYEWVTNFNGSNVNGGLLISKTNPNAYVFFPATGEGRYGHINDIGSKGAVWSSSYYNSYAAHRMYINSKEADVAGTNRYYGFSVRGVHAAI